MHEGKWFVDATSFMGMHHENALIRERSVAFFRYAFHSTVFMNLEQVGLCDALVWQFPRAKQDAYYPFMDRLHTDMHIERSAYAYAEIRLALETKQLRDVRPWQALLAAQVLYHHGTLFTHDPELQGLPCLKPHLGQFDRLLETARKFPGSLDVLYQHSKALIVTEKDWDHVSAAHLHSPDHTA